MFALLVLALFASASANVYFDSKCPEVKSVENFNLASYAKGKWYEVARYPNRAEGDANCGNAEYTLEGDIFKVKNSDVRNNKAVYIEGFGRLAEDAGNTGKIIFTLPYGISGKEKENDFNIMSIDYDNYLIGYYCRYDEELKIRQDFAWILSRTKTLSSDLKKNIVDFVKESKILESSRFVWPDFSEKACKSASANVYFGSKCPEVKSVENFNLASYAKGKWYEVARYPNRAEGDANCGNAEYTLEGDIFKVKNSDVRNNKAVYIEGFGRLAEDAGNTGKIIFTLPYGISGKEKENDFNIISIDYDNYLIGYYCRYDEELKIRQDFAWILSRTKILSSDLKKNIVDFVKESKILESSRFVWPDFSEEACKSASANVYFGSKCPEVKSVENFNLASYAKGKWYEVARYPNRAEGDANCGNAEYTLEGDIFKVKNSDVRNKKAVYIEGFGRLAEDAGNTGKIIFTLPYGISGKEKENDFNIMSIDYDNYLIGYYCRYDEELKIRQDFAWILSRTKTLSSNLKKNIVDFVKESKVLESSRFVWPDFSEEACRIED